MNRSPHGVIRFLLLLFSFLTANLVLADSHANATISVRGEAVVEVAADQVVFSISVETVAKTAEKALDQNNRLMSEVRKELLREGLTESEYSTGQFSVMPQWQPRPLQANANWKPKIVGYRVRNQLQIESSRIDNVGQWVQVATEAGANQIGQLRFGLQQPEKYRAKVITEAVRNARGYADAAAMAAEVKIGGLASIQVDGASVRPLMPVRQERMAMAMADGMAKSAPQVTPGKIEVRSNVSITYLVE
ncbi:MAG: SIMPL domain-containing protein [Motiliproteus sp.]|nr:SIMPL domain-containing protein [Motiliproteus sp.]MCW9051788.1 SIMPL domain-containing protein [Motiliproteus sp.]